MIKRLGDDSSFDTPTACRLGPPMRRREAAVGIAASLCAPLARSQGYPNKVSRIVVPVGPGGLVDILARAFAQELSAAMGQQFIVENKGGAAGQLAADAVAKSAGDPYTLFIGSLGIMGISPHLYPNLPYDVQRDFTPLALCARQPYGLVVNPARVPVRNVAEFVKWAKAQTEPIPFGTYGSGSVSQMAGLLFAQAASVPMTQVPYRAAPNILTDLVKGDLPLMFDAPGEYLGYVPDGRLRVIAVTTAQRLPILPDVPTLAESGFRGFDVANWFAMYGPRDLPAAVTDRLRAELGKVLRNPKVKDRFAPSGLETVADGAANFAKFHAGEFTRWQAFIRANNIKISS
ncbi:MAG TPA: tripartite tricarboxylate transporter substrate binding protein [Ramlibacter sp.]|nr:tripartite tricarboxylate transporter substrate binding protein [Ramlibacter sp.]